MVVAQFTISVAIIVGTITVSTQLQFLLNKDLGYDKEQLVIIKRTLPLKSGHQAFCREIEKTGRKAMLCKTDVSDSEAVKRMVECVKKRL